MTSDQNGVVTWIALITAILALILAWSAFNRAGKDLEEMVADQVEEAVAEVRDEYEAAEDATLEATADTLEAGAAGLNVTADAVDASAEGTADAAADVRSTQ